MKMSELLVPAPQCGMVMSTFLVVALIKDRLMQNERKVIVFYENAAYKLL